MNNPLFDNAYVKDILDQPDALDRTLAAFTAAIFKEFEPFAARLRSGKLRRVVLTGMGSSYHGFHPLFLGLVRRGIPAQMIETSELIHYADGLLTPETLVVLASQSGNGAEVLRLLERMPKGCNLIGVTNTPDSPLATQARAVLLTRAGAEFSVSCKTYVASLAALAVLQYLLAGEDPRPVLDDLQSLPAAVAGYLDRLEEEIGQVMEEVRGIRYLALAGRGPSLAAAGTGGLIIKEAAHFPTEGMSCAAFRHGPLDLVSDETLVVVYEGLPATAALNARLAADVRMAGGRAVLVTNGVPMDAFRLPYVPAEGLPMLEILPAQLLSVALAQLHEHEPGQFSIGSKVTTSE